MNKELEERLDEMIKANRESYYNNILVFLEAHECYYPTHDDERGWMHLMNLVGSTYFSLEEAVFLWYYKDPGAPKFMTFYI